MQVIKVVVHYLLTLMMMEHAKMLVILFNVSVEDLSMIMIIGLQINLIALEKPKNDHFLIIRNIKFY